MKDIKVNTKEAKDVGNGSGIAAHEMLLAALADSKGYSMRTVDAIELLYPNDPRSADKVKNSFASVKTHCWTKSDYRVEYTDSQRENIAIVGKRAVDENGNTTNKYNPVA